jgi:hypothetical protein
MHMWIYDIWEVHKNYLRQSALKSSVPLNPLLPVPVKLNCKATAGSGRTPSIMRATASLVERPPKLLRCVTYKTLPKHID